MRLEPHRTFLKEIFNVLIQRLGVVVADLGKATAGDATDLSARRKPVTLLSSQTSCCAGWPIVSRE